MIEATPDAAKKRLSRAKQRLRAVYLAQNAPPSAGQEPRPPGAPHMDLMSRVPAALRANGHAFTSPRLSRSDPESFARKEWRA